MSLLYHKILDMSNDASPYGDMMNLLRKYDVARFTRNDAMFAPMCRQAHIIRRSRHHWRSQHHLPKANIIQKTHLCHKTKVRFLLVRATGLFLVATPQSRVLDFGFATLLGQARI